MLNEFLQELAGVEEPIDLVIDGIAVGNVLESLVSGLRDTTRSRGVATLSVDVPAAGVGLVIVIAAPSRSGRRDRCCPIPIVR